jgi:hypothetical protein
MSEFQTSNRHAADALADTRRMIKELEFREEELRSYLIANPSDRVGDEFLAMIRPYVRKSVNMEALRAEVGAEVVERFMVAKPFEMVRLSPVRRPSAWRRAG